MVERNDYRETSMDQNKRHVTLHIAEQNHFFKDSAMHTLMIWKHAATPTSFFFVLRQHHFIERGSSVASFQAIVLSLFHTICHVTRQYDTIPAGKVYVSSC